jgi:hypothetical protein
MSIWNWLFDDEALPGFRDTVAAAVAPMVDTNPATGLPMVDGCGGFDVGGSPFGMDMHFHSMDHEPIVDLDFGSSNAGFDENWPC